MDEESRPKVVTVTRHACPKCGMPHARFSQAAGCCDPLRREELEAADQGGMTDALMVSIWEFLQRHLYKVPPALLGYDQLGRAVRQFVVANWDTLASCYRPADEGPDKEKE